MCCGVLHNNLFPTENSGRVVRRGSFGLLCLVHGRVDMADFMKSSYISAISNSSVVYPNYKGVGTIINSDVCHGWPDDCDLRGQILMVYGKMINDIYIINFYAGTSVASHGKLWRPTGRKGEEEDYIPARMFF